MRRGADKEPYGNHKMEGFKYSAASANAFGMEVHETAAALGTFANAGIKGLNKNRRPHTLEIAC